MFLFAVEYTLSAEGSFWNVDTYTSCVKIHGHGSIWQRRVCVNGSVQKPAIILRARACVPSPHVTVHDVQLVQSE
jgi:hypothetical protein